MANSISVEGYNRVVVGAYPTSNGSPPSVTIFLKDFDGGGFALARLSPVNAMALASSLVGAAEYVLPQSELHDAEEDAIADELEEYDE